MGFAQVGRRVAYAAVQGVAETRVARLLLGFDHLLARAPAYVRPEWVDLRKIQKRESNMMARFQNFSPHAGLKTSTSSARPRGPGLESLREIP